MSALTDPSLCPDCRARLDADARCPRCGLVLAGPAAAELWTTMVTAQGLVDRLRAEEDERSRRRAEQLDRRRAEQPVPVGVGAGPSARGPSGTTPSGTAPGMVAPPSPMGPHPAADPRLRGSGVSIVLYVLGAIFVLIAANVFFATTWAVLPLVVKALIMLGVTGGFMVGAEIAAGRGMSGTRETLWTIGGVLILIDVAAAHSTGLVDLGSHVPAVGGGVLAAASLAFCLRMRTYDVHTVAGQLAVGVGLLLVELTEVVFAPGPDGLAEIVAVVVMAAAALALARPLPLAAALAGTGSVLAWLGLIGVGLEGAATSADRADYWASVAGWPLAAAALLIGAATAVRALPGALRALAAGAALVLGAWFLLLPPSWDGTQLAVLAAVTVAMAALAMLSPRLWGRVAARIAAVLAGASLVLVAALLTTAVAWAYRFTGPFDGSPDAPIRLLTAPDGWSLAALGLAVAATLVACRRPLGLAPETTRLLVPPVLALGALGWLADLGLPLLLVVPLFVLAGLSAVPAALLSTSPRQRSTAAVVTVALLAAAVVIAAQDELITAVLATVLAAVGWALTGALRERPLLPGVVAVVAANLTGYAVWSWTATLEAPDDVRALTLAAAAAVLLMAAPRVLDAAPRILLEAGIGPVAIAAVLLSPDAGTGAAVLTLLGAAVALWTILHRDRRLVAWLSTALLLLATLLRVSDGAEAPELLSLPVAALLLVGGALALRRDVREGSVVALGPGLTLALTPSLVLGLGDPLSWHMLLAGALAVAALAVGARARLQAPFLWGAAGLLLIALRFAVIALEFIVRYELLVWITFGAVGMLLLIAAILFEQTLRGLRRGWGYVSSLR